MEPLSRSLKNLENIKFITGTPPSSSIHEEATSSTVVPYMSVFNNLVMFDQAKPVNSINTIVPDLATSWEWGNDKSKLTFKLRKGVSFMTANFQNVACTWNLILGKSKAKLRRIQESLGIKI